MEGQVMCPVCTLYLRSGITLSDHLNTHPKESVIEAFVKTINKRPDEVNNFSADGTNINNVPSVMYQQFVNNYGPVNNGNYHNTVITANVSNSTNASTIPVIVSPPSQPLPQPAPNPDLYPVNYNPYPLAYNYNYAAPQNPYPQTNSFAYGQITSYERENETNDADPLSSQQTNTNDQVPENSLNLPAVNNYDSHSMPTQSADTVNVDTNVHVNLNKENNNTRDCPVVQEGFPCPRRDATSQCSESCDGDFLDLDNQIRNTNIGTVISDSHQAISPQEYSESEVSAVLPGDALQGDKRENSDAHNPKFFASSVNDRNEEDEEMYIIPEDNANFMDNAKQMANFAANIAASMAATMAAGNPNSETSSKSHHSSLGSLFSDDEEEEEFVICDDIETAKRTERENSSIDPNEEESQSFIQQGACLDYSNAAMEACGVIDSDVDGDLNENDDDESMMLSPIINIETDEMMPPHGELSGQESLSENSLWSNHCGSSSPPYQILYDAKQETCNKSFKEQQEDAKPEKCPTCSASFSHPDRYKIHIQTCCAIKEQDPLAGTSKDVVRSVCSKSEINEKKFDQNKKFQCICCSLEFDSMKKLSSHVNLVHSLKSNQCPTCLEAFSTSVDFKMHVRTVHPLECTICGKYFNTRAGLQLHRKRHLSVRPYSCANCNKSFVTKQKLQEHVNVHLNRAPIRCKLCPDNVCFKSYSNLIQHRRVVHAKLGKKIKDYFCDCGEIFHSKKRLFWHSEMHGKPKSCRYCSRKFMHLSSLTRHIRRMHDQSFLPKLGRENKENVTCPMCKQMFLRTSLASHMQTHSGKKPYLCEICNKTFTTKWNLNAHRWIHMSRKLKPHKCKLCTAAFIHLPDLQAHERSHSKTRPFSCNYCGKQFIHQYNCIRHVREHEQEKRFTCEVCKKTFHRSYYLSEHLKIHSGVKPFSCHICGKTSTTKSNHNKHVRTHHAREPVSSEV